jgi:hypothetical protein
MFGTKRKLSLALLSVVAGFLVAAVFIAPRVVQIDRYRPEIISYIEQQTGRRVEIGRLQLSLLPVFRIEVDQFALANPPGFPNGNWVTVKSIDARVDAGALFRRQVIIQALELKGAVLDLYSGPQGSWNFQAVPPAVRVPVPSNDPPPFVFRKVSNLMLIGGQIEIERLLPDGASGPPILRCAGLTANLDQIDIPEWTALPVAPSARAAPGQSVVRVRASSSSGKLRAAAIWFGNFLATHVEAGVHATPAHLSFSGVQFDFYGGRASGTGSLNLPGGSYQAQAQLSGVNVEKFLAEVPALRGQMTGTMDGRITFSGGTAASADRWAGKQGEGELIVRKGKWPKLRLDQTVLALAHLAQLGPVSGDLSTFSSVAAVWQLRDGLLEISRFRAIGRGITLDGSASVDLASQDQLQVEGLAGIAARPNPLSSLLARLSGGTFHGHKIDVPFVVVGTLQHPVFQLKTQAPSPPPAGLKR